MTLSVEHPFAPMGRRAVATGGASLAQAGRSETRGMERPNRIAAPAGAEVCRTTRGRVAHRFSGGGLESP